MIKAKPVSIKKIKYHIINLNDLDPFLLDIKKKKNLQKTLTFIALITFKEILMIVIHCA